MPKQLNVNLGFTADTSQARQQIQQLKQSLEQLSVSTVGQSPFSKMPAEVMKAQQSVLKLKSILDSSLNANTGQLDLSKFNQQLGSAGMSIQSLATDMTALGADGQKAFLNLANSIVSTQKPMIETNKLLDGMWTALKNTARWQLSSSLLHGFMGAIQGAYSYAQNLDESLTNIAIVTGRSREEMADFAEQANKSAQALSASTTAYTDAALIYYQQGLGDEDVQARTDATIKLANVTGQSAEQISSYMTAIWNNFAEGSENVEYFADVITALGAHTASSSEEIARGMQQFASVANTVGLSYEYAASALATIVAQTRQSETSVGNGLRTIFARLDSLKMGETLEDGVSLTKYTEALQKAGVEVLDQNGKLKDMNTILDEIGERWQALDETQKATLANTVGGVRQYSNLMALFDNWDQFKENVAVAEGSEGSLEGQAEIYAQSWEAAQKRVKAAWQAIYQDLIDSDFFIGFLNTLEKVLHGIDVFIDGVGGIPGVLSAVGVAVTSLFGDKVLAGIQSAQQSLKVMTGVAKKEADYVVQQTVDTLDKQIGLGSEDSANTARIQGLKEQVLLNHQLKTVTTELAASKKGLTQQEQEYFNKLIETTNQLNEATVKAKEFEQTSSEAFAKAKASIRDKFRDFAAVDLEDPNSGYQKFEQLMQGKTGEIETIVKIKDADIAEQEIEKLITKYHEYGKEAGLTSEEIRKVIQTHVEFVKSTQQAETAVQNEAKYLAETKVQLEAVRIAKEKGVSIEEARAQAIANINTQLDEEAVKLQEQADAVQKEIDAMLEKEPLDENEEKQLEELSNKYDVLTRKIQENAQAKKNNNEVPTTPPPSEPTKDFNTGIFSPEFAKGVQTAFSGLSRLTMGLNSLSTAFDILNNKELEPLERVKKALPSLLMGLPAVASGFMTLGGLIPGVSAAMAAYTAAANGATFSMAGLKAAFDALVAGGFFWFIAAAAAIAGLVLVVKSATDAWNADAKAAEEAAKKAEEAKQKYQEVRQEFNELKSSLENHQAAVNALEELKQGTEEWYEAVQKLNEETLDLITKYPELAKYVENVDGSLRLNKDGMQEYLNAQYADLQKGYIDVINTQQEAAKTANQSSVTDTARSITYGNTTEVTTSTGTYQAGGKTASNEEILAAVEAFKANSEDFLKAGENLAEPTKAFTELLAEQGIKDAELVQALWDNRDGIATLSQELDANTESSQGLKDAYIQSSVQNEMGQQIQQDLDAVGMGAYSSDVQQYLVDQVSKDLADAEQWTFEAYQEALQNARDNFEENKGQILDDIANKKSADMATTLSNNSGAQYSPEDVRAYIESDALTDQEREIVIKYGIKEDSASFEDIKQSAIEKREELKKEFESTPVELDTDGLTKKQAAELQEEFANLTEYIQENAEEIDELDDHLKDCTKESSRVARAIIRFDDAIQDVTENYDDWNRALKSGSMQAAAKAADEMQDAYGNLLDIDGSVLSSQFLENAENLDLMKEALNGNEEAYQALQEKANEDIIAHCDVDTTKFDAAMETVQNHLDAMNFQELKIGADLDDGNFLQELSNLVNAAGMTAEKAEAYLANMGIDATVTEHETDTEETQETASFHPTITEGAHAEGTAYTMDGDTPKPVDLPYQFYGVRYEPDTDQITTSKQAKNFTLEVTSAHKSSGGGFKYNQASHGGGGSGGGKGGSCFAAGTQIILNNLQKSIENIEPGDLVLSYNEKTHKNEFSKVVQTMIHNVYEKIYNLFVKNDKLVVTGNHRFLITRNNKQEWIQVADIKTGDLVFLSTGELCKISNIDIEKKFLTVYNFEVSNTHNYYVGESHILAHNKGGGGGSKPKKKKVEKKKDPTKNIKEADRYHNIKEKIEDLNTEMKRLNENKDRAYGKDRIKWMDEEIKKTEEQIKLTDEYIDEIKSYAKIDKEDLQKKLGSFISDADFDENGVLKDYEGLLAKIQGAFDDNVTAALNKATAEYNAAVDKFNASDQGDDATEEFENAKEAWDKAKETYDKEKETYEERLKSLKQYEDTINLLQEKEQERIDQLNELYDKWLARTTYKVEISLEMNEDDMNYLQWVYDNLGDSADKAADRISLLSKQMKTTQKDIATYKKGIEELFAQNGMNVDLSDDLNGTQLGERLDQLIQKMREQGGEPNIQEVIDKLSEYRDGLMDTYDTMRDLADAATENVVNAYDEWNKRLQENLDLMDHYDSVIDTIKEIADLLGEDQLGLGDEQAKAYEQAKLDNQRNAAAIAKDNYDAIAKERERVQKLLETSESETEKKHWEEVLKNLQEAENEAMEEYLSRWRDALRQAEENYQASLDRNEKAYQKAMSGGMGTLDMLQEQFDRQKELDDLYLDDYEKYKKLGDITSKINKNLANNPSPMIQEKMKNLLDDVNAKMENGADISEGEATILEKRLALLEAEDQLLAARNAKSAVRMTRDNEGNFSYTYTADTSKIEEAQQNYADKFYELLDYEKQYSDETQGNMLKSWQDFINKRNEILEDDMLSEDERNKAMERLQADYDKMVAYYSDELNMVMEEMSRLKTDDWKDMENILGRLLAGPEDFETDLSKTTLGQLTNAWSDPEGMAKSWRDAADTLYTQDADARAAWVAANEETNRRVDTSTKEFAENYKSTLGEIVEASDEVADSAEKMAEEMPKAMTEVLNEAENFFNEFGGYIDTLFTNIQNIVKAINELKDVLAGVDPEYRTSILGEKVSKTADYELPVKPVSGATGMYTGEWGTGGKLAILHEKELLLNEADTQNILKAVDFVRNMPQFGGVFNINNNVDYSKLAAVGATDLQQQVHIDASFPNVESHTEIELALNNLINSASQYVNRK